MEFVVATQIKKMVISEMVKRIIIFQNFTEMLREDERNGWNLNKDKVLQDDLDADLDMC